MRLEAELAALGARMHQGGSHGTPGSATKTSVLSRLPPPTKYSEGGGGRGHAEDDDARVRDDDVRSVRSAVSSFSAASEVSVTDAAAGATGTPEVCGVGMRLTNAAPHRVCCVFFYLFSFMYLGEGGCSSQGCVLCVVFRSCFLGGLCAYSHRGGWRLSQWTCRDNVCDMSHALSFVYIHECTRYIEGTYIYIYICMHICMYTYIYIYFHIYICMHTYIHIHTHNDFVNDFYKPT